MLSNASFGQIVKERRSALDLTQAELANRVGCAPITIRRIEANNLRPSFQMAELLALALRIPEVEQLGFVRLAREKRAKTPIPKPTPSPGEIGMADLTGRAVKGFQLGELIGSGGFGVVYRAVQPSVNRDVAVKIILPRFANQPEFIRRFEAEAQLVARLEHPHIVPLYDYWREPDAAYLIMRLLRGGSLEDQINSGPISFADFQKIVPQICIALHTAHRNGIIHRDIKPANVMLDEDKNGYLTDFGIAKNLEASEESQLTQMGALIGSPTYISPEQILAEPIQVQSDIYCLGIMLFEILTGKKPFQGPTPVAYLQQHLNDMLPHLQEIGPDFPVMIDDVIQKATAKKPQDRYQSTLELLADLESGWQTIPVALQGQTTASISTLPDLSAQELAALENPYRGLRPFTEADATNFHGRSELVQELLVMMADGSDLSRFVAVVGPSGSGKSSVVKAGLIPALRRGGLPESDNWFIVDLTPGGHPWEKVEAALLRIAINPPDSLLAQLRDGNRGLLRAVQRILPEDDETELLLVIDQFEELFTLVEDEAVRIHFLESLVTAVLDPQSRLRLIITLRADFTDRPLQYVDFGELMRQRTAFVLPLTPQELTDAVTRPVAQLNMEMEPALVSTIIREVDDQPGMLPLLQYALTELFEERHGRTLTLANYEATGGALGALARRADDIYNKLDAPTQEATCQLFLRLITLGEGVEDTRRRVLLTEIESMDFGMQNADFGGKQSAFRNPQSAIEEYGRYRLLTFDHDPVTRRPTVEVAHEALLREWPRLHNWLTDSREDVRRQRLLAGAASQWQHATQESGYLLRGSRLIEFESWIETTTVALTKNERSFLENSISTRDLRHAEEEARRQRELETVQKLANEQTRRAEEQAQSAYSLRRRALFLTVASVVAVILAVVAFSFARSSTNNANLASTREIEVAQQRDEAQASERAAQKAYSLSLAANARQLLEAEDQELALLLALAANSVESPPLASWRTLLDIAYAPGTIDMIEYDQPIFEIDVSDDGRYLASCALDGTVLVWDLENRELIKEFEGHTRTATHVAISPDNRYILSSSYDRSAILWDFETGEIIHQLSGNSGTLRDIDFTPDGKHAMFGVNSNSAPGEIVIWNLENGEVASRFGATEMGNKQGLQGIAISSDGRMVLAGAGNNSFTNPHPLILWDVESEEVIHYFDQIVDWVNGVAISPDGKYGLATYSDNNIYYLDLESGEIVHRLSGHDADPWVVTFSPNGRTALSSSIDRTMIWWDLSAGSVLQRFHSHSEVVQGLTFINDNQAISSSTDGTIRFWDLTSEWQLDQWATDAPENFSTATSLAISPDGRFALTGTHGDFSTSFFGNESWQTLSPNVQPENGLMLWDYETGELLSSLYGHDKGINDIAFTADSRWALTGSADSSIILWNLQSGSQIKQLFAHNGGVVAVAISSDGKHALTASGDGQVFYWDFENDKVLQRMSGHIYGGGLSDVAFLSGDQLAISSSRNGNMIVWDLSTGQQIHRLTGYASDVGNHLVNDSVNDLNVTQDGRHVLSAGNTQILLWNIESGEPITKFAGHPAAISHVIEHPNAQTILSTDPENGIIIWDAESGKIVRQHTTNGMSIEIHPNGETALSTSLDGSIIKWQLVEPNPSELVSWIQENRFLREFTCLERESYQITPLCENEAPLETTVDLLTSVAESIGSLQYDNNNNQSTELPTSLNLSSPGYPEFEAAIGENRGELTRHQFDIWNFQGEAGQIINLRMEADNPTENSSTGFFDRFEAGLLDPMLIVIAPDGTLLGRGDDNVAEDGTVISEATINSIILPQDGIYQIQARSFIDELAGPYTLTIESQGKFVVDPQILTEYEGKYLEGPWEFDVFIYVEEGRLKLLTEQTGGIYNLTPTSENKFFDEDGSIVVFTRDESGQVDGYDLWVSLIHPVGGQWYHADRLDE